MRKGELLVLAAFAALVVGGAVLLGPALLGRSERPRSPAPAPGGAPAPAPGPTPGPSGRGPVLGERIAARAIGLEVVEADGRPAADVPVEYGPPAVRAVRRTGADGRFVIDDAMPGVLRVHVGGAERDGPTLVLRAGRDVAARAVLEPGFRIAGVVVDPAGAAVAGADVGVGSPDGAAAPRARTDRQGRFELTARASEALVVEVVAAGFQTTRVEPPLPDPTTGPASSSVRVVLARAANRLGATIDRRGLGPTDRVEVEVEAAVLSPAREAFGADVVVGEPLRFDSPPRVGFEVEGWPSDVPVRVRLRGGVIPEDHVLRPGEARARDLRLAPERAPAPAPTPPAASLPPERLGSIHGAVRDGLGRALAGITVVVEGRRAVTGADGAFTVEGLPRGERVEAVFGWLDGAEPGDADPAAFAPWASAMATVGGDPLVAVLASASGLSARLLDGVTDRPLSWARIVLLDDRSEVALDRCVAAVDGRVAFDGLPLVGAGSLVLLAPGLRKEVPVAPRAGRRLELGDVRLGRGGRVTGVVKDRAGRPVVDAAVAVLEDGRIERPGLERLRRRDVALRRARTGADGTFTLDGLDPGAPLALAVAAEGLAPTVRRVLFPDGPEARIAVTLAKGGRLRVELSDASGAPISGASIELMDARSGARLLDVVLRATLEGVVGSTDDLRRAGEALLLEDPGARGAYRIGPVEPGPYDVLFACPGFRPSRQKLTVPDAEPEDPSSPVRPLPLSSLAWRVTLEAEPDSAPGR